MLRESWKAAAGLGLRQLYSQPSSRTTEALLLCGLVLRFMSHYFSFTPSIQSGDQGWRERDAQQLYTCCTGGYPSRAEMRGRVRVLSMLHELPCCGLLCSLLAALLHLGAALLLPAALLLLWVESIATTSGLEQVIFALFACFLTAVVVLLSRAEGLRWHLMSALLILPLEVPVVWLLWPWQDAGDQLMFVGCSLFFLILVGAFTEIILCCDEGRLRTARTRALLQTGCRSPECL